jgi:hypothetical protein
MFPNNQKLKDKLLKSSKTLIGNKNAAGEYV